MMMKSVSMRRRREESRRGCRTNYTYVLLSLSHPPLQNKQRKGYTGKVGLSKEE